MLNPFPIQFLALFAYFILRVIAGFILVHLGYGHIVKRQSLGTPVLVLGTIELIAGVMLILGFYTQFAALASLILSFIFLVFNKRFMRFAVPDSMFYTLLFAVSLSLFITGAGAFAFDLPI